jgi:hypothetical protein
MAGGGAPKRRANATPPAARKRAKDDDSEAPREHAHSARDSALSHFPRRSPSTLSLPLNLQQQLAEPRGCLAARGSPGAQGAREPAPLQAMLSSLSSLPRSVTLSESPVGRAGAAVAESIAGLEATARRHEAAPQRPAPDGGWYADVTRACNFAARLVTRACGLAERWDHARASAAAAGAESPDLLAKAQQMRRMAVELDKLQIADRHLLRSRVSEAGAWCSEASEELMKHMAAQDDAVIRVVTHAATQLEALGDDEMELVDELLRGEEEGSVREMLARLTSAKAAYDEAYAIKAFSTQLAPALPPLDLQQVSPLRASRAHLSLSRSLVCSHALLLFLLCVRVAEE